jgi:hypothetical protein
MNIEVIKMTMPKHPCIGCIYYKVCGESTRTEPCYGRRTKREVERDRKFTTKESEIDFDYEAED